MLYVHVFKIPLDFFFFSFLINTVKFLFSAGYTSIYCRFLSLTLMREVRQGQLLFLGCTGY